MLADHRQTMEEEVSWKGKRACFQKLHNLEEWQAFVSEPTPSRILREKLLHPLPDGSKAVRLEFLIPLKNTVLWEITGSHCTSIQAARLLSPLSWGLKLLSGVSAAAALPVPPLPTPRVWVRRQLLQLARGRLLGAGCLAMQLLRPTGLQALWPIHLGRIPEEECISPFPLFKPPRTNFHAPWKGSAPQPILSFSQVSLTGQHLPSPPTMLIISVQVPLCPLVSPWIKNQNRVKDFSSTL